MGRIAVVGPGSEEPWTAARCQHLLQQLQARISNMRRLISGARTMPARKTKRPNPGPEATEDCKRIRYTYAQKRRAPASARSTQSTSASTPPRSFRTLGTLRPGVESPAPDRGELPTPFWRRIRDNPHQPPATRHPISGESSSSTTYPIPADLVSSMQALRRIAPEGHYRIYESIVAWLGNLLQCTRDRRAETQAKSLLGMCLRKIPHCVESILAWERQVSHGDGGDVLQSGDVALDIYRQLESFGSSESGWRPLRVALRAQAIAVLSEAISEGLFMPEFVGALVHLCRTLDCNLESYMLTSSLPNGPPSPYGRHGERREVTSLQPIAAILEGANVERIPSTLFQCFSALIEDKRLPVPWLSTRGSRNLWRAAVEAVMQGHLGEPTISFIPKAVEWLFPTHRKQRHPRRNKSSATLVSILAGVATAAVSLSQTKAGRSDGERHTRQRRGLVYILDCCMIDMERCHVRLKSSRKPFLLALSVARYLATSSCTELDARFRAEVGQELEQLTSRAMTEAEWGEQYQLMVLLVCSIAQGLSRESTEASHQLLSEMCGRIDRLAVPSWLTDGLRSDGAVVLALKTKDARDLAFAKGLPEGAAAARMGTVFSGWRWEDGISEWIPQSSPGRDPSTWRVEAPDARANFAQRPPEVGEGGESREVGVHEGQTDARAFGQERMEAQRRPNGQHWPTLRHVSSGRASRDLGPLALTGLVGDRSNSDTEEEGEESEIESEMEKEVEEVADSEHDTSEVVERRGLLSLGAKRGLHIQHQLNRANLGIGHARGQRSARNLGWSFNDEGYMDDGQLEVELGDENASESAQAWTSDCQNPRETRHGGADAFGPGRTAAGASTGKAVGGSRWKGGSSGARGQGRRAATGARGRMTLAALSQGPATPDDWDELR